MEKIYLSKDDFDKFINRKYHLRIENKAKKQVKQSFYLELKQEYADADPVFLSTVSKIVLPDESYLPQLKTLYGIPAGLLEVKPKKTDVKKAKPKAWELTVKDLEFAGWRRAMLFFHAWGIKVFEVEAVKMGVNYLFKNDSVPLLKALISECVQFGKYPEVKPNIISLDNTQYDFQFIGLGVFLSKFFFPEMETMDAEHRDWLRYKLNAADFSNVPERFKGIEGILAGYLIALKAFNQNQLNSEYILEKAGKFKTENRTLYYGMLISALFFAGLFESKANMYFFAAAAGKLFSKIEQFCYAVVNEESCLPDFEESYISVTDAILNPLPNVVEYYKLKNPSVEALNVFEFSDENKFPENDQTITVIRPEQSFRFLMISDKLIRLNNYYQDKLTITNNPELYRYFCGKSYPVILHRENGMIEGSFRVGMNAEICVDNQLTARWLKKSFPQLSFNNSFTPDFSAKHWILVSENFQLNDTDRFVFRTTGNKPESITVFNFSGQPLQSNTKPAFVKSKKNPKTDLFDENLTPENHSNKPTGSNPVLQMEFEKIFPEVPVRIITKYSQDTPWEMVLLGIGALQNIGFAESILIDLRNNNADSSVFEVILRCFRDIIVYDKGQRYMFMNLT